jgi:solute carrier family 25 carnitine/acylcarnitine transporter 20/29
MRLFHLIPLSLLALLSYSLAASDSQSTLHSSEHTLSTTLVDVLSDDPDYSTLLHLLQRARLIPTLNRLNGSTLFAPTNDAIRRHPSLSRLNSLAGDNVNEQLRQELFYHLLNYTVTLPEDNDILVTKTLHFPHDYLEPPSRDPPPSPPWLPIPGGTLGGEPQRLRVASRKGRVHVGVDGFGNGGAQVIKGPTGADNGLLIGIDSILPVPPSLGAYHSSLSHACPNWTSFQRMLSPRTRPRLTFAG